VDDTSIFTNDEEDNIRSVIEKLEKVEHGGQVY
jgi:hypothetical protein